MFTLKRNLSKPSRLSWAALILLASLCRPTYSICTARAEVGTFLGLSKLSALNHTPMCSYIGIRYAKPPTGDNRFGDPIPEDPVTRPTPAVADGSFCPQILKSIPLSFDEDCLVLNVYTPDKVQSDSREQPLKPVIVYIHGGALLVLSSNSLIYSPDFLVENDVVVVTINYRLNVLGFLGLGVPECAGNMGLKDQNLALKWVQKNIRGFGGDPNRVTLMGESAGAWSAALHAMSPKSRGLFDKMILQSPICINYVNNDTLPNSFEFAKSMGYDGDMNDGHAACRFLKQLNIVDLISGFGIFADKLFASDITFNFGFTPFHPILDGDMGDKAFLPKPLAELGKSVPAMPIISGQVGREGSAFFLPWNGENYTSGVLNGPLEGVGTLLDKLIDIPVFVAGVVLSVSNERIVARIRDHLEDYLNLVVFTNGEKATREQVARVLDYYFNQRDGTEVASASDLYADLAFYRYYDQLAEFDASFKNGLIYNYEVNYDQPAEIFKIVSYGLKDSLEVNGTAHAADVEYNFYSAAFHPVFAPSDNEKKVIRLYSAIFTNFAKTGNPNGDNTGLARPWQPINPQKLSYQLIGTNPKFIQTRIHESRRAFMESVIHSK